MAVQPIRREMLEHLHRLPLDQQRVVLEFTRSLAETCAGPKGKPGRTLLRFAGSIDSKDLVLMREAIEDACERIDLNEWQVPSRH